MTNRSRFATIAGTICFVALGGFVLANKESDTGDFNKAMSRLSGNWDCATEMFLPGDKNAIFHGTVRMSGKDREFRFVADLKADKDSVENYPQNMSFPNVSITKFIRLTPNGEYTLDESPAKLDNLNLFAEGRSSTLRMDTQNGKLQEVVEFKITESGVDITVANGQVGSSVNPSLVFHLKKVQA